MLVLISVYLFACFYSAVSLFIYCPEQHVWCPKLITKEKVRACSVHHRYYWVKAALLSRCIEQDLKGKYQLCVKMLGKVAKSRLDMSVGGTPQMTGGCSWQILPLVEKLSWHLVTLQTRWFPNLSRCGPALQITQFVPNVHKVQLTVIIADSKWNLSSNSSLQR